MIDFAIYHKILIIKSSQTSGLDDNTVQKIIIYIYWKNVQKKKKTKISENKYVNPFGTALQLSFVFPQFSKYA